MFGPPAAVAAEIRAEMSRMAKMDELSTKAEAIGSLRPEEFAEGNRQRWRGWLEAYARRLADDDAAGGATSAAELGAAAIARREAMRSTNPRVVLHNWIAQAREQQHISTATAAVPVARQQHSTCHRRRSTPRSAATTRTCEQCSMW